MTISELIQKLQGFDGDRYVYVTGYDEYEHLEFYGYVQQVTIDEDGEVGLLVK
jgi:hypothetical protein